MKLDPRSSHLMQITLPPRNGRSGACFGVVQRASVVVEAAPIGRWMVGRHWVDVQRWIDRQGGTVRFVFERLPQTDPLRTAMIGALTAEQAEAAGGTAP